MAHVITINGGGTETVFSLEDLMELVDEHLGMDARRALEEMLSDTYADEQEWEAIEEEHKKELDEIREHYHSVILELREQSEILANLISAELLDRGAISNCAGKIGTITWREL